MSEAAYRIEQFQNHLGKLTGRQVYLYGAGRTTIRLLERYGGQMPFQGIIVPEKELELPRPELEAVGLPRFSFEEALDAGAEIILLCAQMYSAEEIYRRIADPCRARGVKLMDLYGFDQLALHEELEAQPWLDLAGWRERTSGYEVISFELPNTVMEQDLLHAREGHVRPVFQKLIPELLERGAEVLLLAAPDDPVECCREVLAREGISVGEGPGQARLLKRDWAEDYFRKLKSHFPERRCLHIGHSVLENGIIPRLCGFDTCRMTYYDIGRLTDFLKEPEHQDPEELSEAAFLAAIREAQAVSFDIFDTLLVRKTSDFRDVFQMTALRAEAEGLFSGADERDRFVKVREELQSGEIFMDRLYERAGELLGLSPEAAGRLEELEWRTEEDVLLPRAGVVHLLEEAVKSGKRVVLTSDMYMGSAQLAKLLRAKGISGYERIFVSCEAGLSKRDGLLGVIAAELKLPPDQILHLGDSLERDGLPARRAGMRFLKIPSAASLAEQKLKTPQTEGTEDTLPGRLLWGIWQAHRYGNPFQGPHASREEKLYKYGFTAAAPVLAGWLLWFFGELERQRPEKILFAARDGYLLRELYESLRGGAFPESVYFYSSRHAAFLLAADRPEMAGYVADMAKGMSRGQMLEHFFGLSGDPEDGPEPASEEQLRETIRENAGRIHLQVESARAGYRAYCEALGLQENARYAYVDFVAAGTSQRLLEEASGFSLQGYSFGRPLTAGAPTCEIHSWISGESEAERAFLARYLELEYYMTSPEPSLAAFDPSGKPLFSKEVRGQEELADIQAVHRGIRDFFREWTKLSGWRDLAKQLASSRPEEVQIKLEALRRMFPAERVCRMYLLSVNREARQRYFDDWSGTWIRTSR